MTWGEGLKLPYEFSNCYHETISVCKRSLIILIMYKQANEEVKKCQHFFGPMQKQLS